MQKMKPQDFTRLTRDKYLYKELLVGSRKYEGVRYL
jgi:hypothetical protein